MKLPPMRARWAALAVVVAVLAATGVAFAVGGGGDDEPVAAPTTTTTEATTTTSESTTTTAAPTTTTAPAPDDVLERGESGPAVADLQRRLTELRFDPGPADGAFGLGTLYAVQAFQKLNGMAPDGKVGPAVRAALANPAEVAPVVPDGGPERVVVDLPRQLLFLYEGGTLHLITHVSTGSGETYCVDGDCGNRAVTPVGAFRFAWRYSGWRESRLGKLYNPVYFTRSGHAVHGSNSVPTHPASHGCVRIPMHIAEYFPSLVKRGDPIYVTDGRDVGPAPETPQGPPPSDPPTSPETTTTTTTAPPESTTTTTGPPGETTTTTTTAPPSPLPTAPA